MAPPAAPPSAAKSVLIVEDEGSLRDFYRSTLRAAGYAAVAVSDGVEALRHVNGDVPDAIVLDLNLPALSGRDLHRELHAHSDTRRIPIVVVTGTDSSDLEPQAFAAILTKPITSDELVAAIDKATGPGGPRRHGRRSTR